jgi:hypothetical protein
MRITKSKQKLNLLWGQVQNMYYLSNQLYNDVSCYPNAEREEVRTFKIILNRLNRVCNDITIELNTLNNFNDQVRNLFEL